MICDVEEVIDVGDVVLFVPIEKIPIPKGEIHGYVLGRVDVVLGDVLTVVDTTKKKHFVYGRHVKVISKG